MTELLWWLFLGLMTVGLATIAYFAGYGRGQRDYIAEHFPNKKNVYDFDTRMRIK